MLVKGLRGCQVEMQVCVESSGGGDGPEVGLEGGARGGLAREGGGERRVEEKREREER